MNLLWLCFGPVLDESVSIFPLVALIKVKMKLLTKGNIKNSFFYIYLICTVFAILWYKKKLLSEFRKSLSFTREDI